MVPAQELERLAGMLAHEIRNPLASATTNLAVACDLMDPADPRAPFLRRAESELDRIGDLVSACLGLATAGRIRRTNCAIDEVVGEVIDRFEERQAPIVIESRIPDGLGFCVDAGLLARCLENLVENSLRECGAIDCRIVIGAAVTSEGLRISVEDSGPGVPTDRREEIFEAFVSGGKGSGLGLCFVRLVTQAHGGTARVTEAAAGGARFELLFAGAEALD